MGRLLTLTIAQTFFAIAALAAETNVDPAAEADSPDPNELIAGAIDLSRGLTSYVQMGMLVHRPGWQRRSALVAWTRGRTDALVRFTAPARDAGNATLRTGEKMWTYTPKLNRIVRLPFSLMSQSWAGSDFSYADLARTDDVLNYYRLTITETKMVDGLQVHLIEAIPHDDAPVVWGKEEWVLREDYVILSQTFFDQDMLPLKRLQTLEIKALGGRLMATRMRMSKLDKEDHYTEMEYLEADFDSPMPDGVFTTFNLQSGAVDG